MPVSLPSLRLSSFFFFFFLMIRRPPRSPLFPYPPLFRSAYARSPAGVRAARTLRRSAASARRRTNPSFSSRPTRSEEHTLNSSHDQISYAVFCLKKKKKKKEKTITGLPPELARSDNSPQP